MAASSNSLILSRNPTILISSGSALNLQNQILGSPCRSNVSFSSNSQKKVKLSTSRKLLTVQAAYRDDGRPSSATIFVGGFVLGGAIVGALTCVFASQINNALTGVNRKELMRKLPKFIYDEDKYWEKKKQQIMEKIDKLNETLDTTENTPNPSTSKLN